MKWKWKRRWGDGQIGVVSSGWCFWLVADLKWFLCFLFLIFFSCFGLGWEGGGKHAGRLLVFVVL